MPEPFTIDWPLRPATGRTPNAINTEENLMSMIASQRREQPRSVLCAGAALALAGLAACPASTSPTSAPLGGAASSGASAGTRGTSDWRSHPCVLLTEAEASAAVGQRVRALENAPGGLCEYVPTDLSAGSGALVIGPIAGPGGWRSCKFTVNNGSNPPGPGRNSGAPDTAPVVSVRSCP